MKKNINIVSKSKAKLALSIVVPWSELEHLVWVVFGWCLGGVQSSTDLAEPGGGGDRGNPLQHQVDPAGLHLLQGVPLGQKKQRS